MISMIEFLDKDIKSAIINIQTIFKKVEESMITMKDIEDTKKETKIKLLEISEKKNTLSDINYRSDNSEEKISEFQFTVIEIVLS